jgi:hypothetical protein
MKVAPLTEQLQSMFARHPGVRGCALVDASSGLVWHREPPQEPTGLWEAAVDHWRLHRRLSAHFGALGEAGAIVTYHHGATMAMLPCLSEPEVILVCVASPSSVDWRAWQDDAKALGRSIVSAM